MKLRARMTGQRLLTALTAAAVALAVSACGDEPRPRPKVAAKAPPPPAIPQAEPMKALPDKPVVVDAQAANQELAARVKSALAAEKNLNAHGIDVVAQDGVVTLFGTAETKARRETASRIAAAVTGVKSVDNKLAVVAGS
ncbi:MAG TPA: BON domain-containing protein [Burkholderiales bacterium]|nr:BON domain-containing protein [Burkholderiales bacterium]